MYYIVCEAPLPIPHRNYTHAAAGQYVTDRCRVIARYIEDLQDEISAFLHDLVNLSDQRDISEIRNVVNFYDHIKSKAV